MITEHIENAYLMLTDAITEIKAFIQDAEPQHEDAHCIYYMQEFAEKLQRLLDEYDKYFMEITDQPKISRCDDCGIRLGLGEIHECPGE